MATSLYCLLAVASGLGALGSAPRVSTPCQSDLDCNLNGRCQQGICGCLAAWTGPTCGQLALIPATPGAGLHAPGSHTANSSSWGGSVWFCPVSQRWQMFAAEMTNHCGIGAWETNSRIVRASSDSPDGQYIVEEQIKPAFAHEPVLQRLADGRWLLYSIGDANSSAPARTDCAGGYSPARCCPGGFKQDGRQVPVQAWVSRGPGLADAGWQHAVADLNPAAGAPGDINPAPLVFANGSAVMMWRGGDHWYDIHLARAARWDQPRYQSSISGSVLGNASFARAHGVEDPVLYTQPWPDRPDEVSYHAIFHDHATFGGHAFSLDAVTWYYSEVVPFTNRVEYTDGTLVLLQRRERPHLIFDERGYISHLTSGAQPPPTSAHQPPAGYQNDYTFTLVQPVRQQPQPPQQCLNNCTHLDVIDGYLGKIFIGRRWSSLQQLIDTRLANPIAGLPGLDANASTMRVLTVTGDYVADKPLILPSRLHFRLNGSVHGDLVAANQSAAECKFGRCSLILIKGSAFVSVTGGRYTCDSGDTAFAISCEGCSNTLVQNLTASGCGQGNIHWFGAGPGIEIRHVESFGSNRGVWSQTPSQKVLITDSYLHDNSADGVDLDSMSANVMVRNNRLANNHRCGVFIEEGASNNIIVDNEITNNTFGIGFYTNLGGKDPGEYPTKDNWIIGNKFRSNGGAISLGGMKDNGATDNFIAENSIEGNGNGWGCNGALVGNHVMTSDTEDPRSARLLDYGPGNVSFFAEPPW